MRLQHYIIKVMVAGSLMLAQAAAAQLPHHRFSDLEQLQKQQERNMVVFVYTEWCAYCKAMEQTTFRDKDLIKILNDQFYFVRFNAEERSDVLWNHQWFRYQPTGRGAGMHQLAIALAQNEGTGSYPFITILDRDSRIQFQYSGFLSAEALQQILRQFLK